MIGCTSETWQLGHHTVKIRRTYLDPYISMPIVVVREATWGEYEAFCQSEGVPCAKDDGDRYYEILMD